MKYERTLVIYLFSLLLIIIGSFSRYSYIINFLSLTILPIFIYDKMFKTQIKLNFKCKDIKLSLITLLSTLGAYTLVFFIFKDGKFNIPQSIGKLSLFQAFYVAIPEEIFFRGILLGSIKKKNSSIISKENVLISILFGITHVITYKNPIMLKVIFPSLILGFLFEKTESLCPPIIVHFSYNIIYTIIPIF
ncbi:CPBP family intramembrane glutamic endopeptidase [Desulfurobacterium atlanticum]|uniref:CAAX prenyl protease 2/Lysostaphin resistance protein A-like domain-containing protein n=1 Tax=Desulfurobacterium atlanticum TaxID=240169 RepID=A0A238YCD2_9BACT|nr:CPBP family intramembrane glutamic endopeptidase [Desulfurobacterium atlanticum]SNR68254.1 hypothetical protein SAMN06265340_1032 [Desulfurobacterium atlanticum]